MLHYSKLDGSVETVELFPVNAAVTVTMTFSVSVEM